MKEEKRFGPEFLIVTTTTGFFVIVAVLLFHELPERAENFLLVTIGAIGSKWQSIVDFFFGSSSGSQRKTDMIQKNGNPPPTGGE